MAETEPGSTYIDIHSWLVRITHWINALAILAMIMSGWRIYNASPLFGFRFPRDITLGGWLGGALQWHFAMMWLLAANGLVYLAYGIVVGHFRKDFTPISLQGMRNDFKQAVTLNLKHRPGVYNSIQRAAYLGVIVITLMLLTSGLAIWKPIQLQELAWLMGGYEGARLMHFFAMALLVAFVTVHVLMVLIVPSSLMAMVSGKAKLAPVLLRRPHGDLPSTESGDAL
jgi:thiosulfate reductase cytochrome b subunit